MMMNGRIEHEITLTRGNLEVIRLKLALLRVMLSERGVLRETEWNQKWPRYLRNDVGIQEPNGKMQGSLKIHFYD